MTWHMTARPHVAEMWIAALFGAMARRGQIPAVPERFTEAAALAEAVGLVAGDGPEAHVARVVDSADAVVIRAERAFRSWWEARERRPVESVSEAEAEDLQRAVLAAIPGGRA